MAHLTINIPGNAQMRIKLNQDELLQFMQTALKRGTFDADAIKAELAAGAIKNLVGQDKKFMSVFGPTFHEMFGEQVGDLMKTAVNEVIEEAKETGRAVFDGEKIHLSSESRKAIREAFSREGESLVKESIETLFKVAFSEKRVADILQGLLQEEVKSAANAQARNMVRQYLSQLQVQPVAAQAIAIENENVNTDNALAAPEYLKDDVANAPRNMLKVQPTAFFSELARFQDEAIFAYVVAPGQFVYTNEQLPANVEDVKPDCVLGIACQYANDAGNGIVSAYWLPRRA